MQDNKDGLMLIKHTDYLNAVIDILKTIDKTEEKNINKAAKIIAASLKNDGILHVFSTGHSHMIAEEMFYRSGGLVQVNAILDPTLMLHEGAAKSTKMERLPGYAKTLLDSYNIKKGETILIISNSGINSVPVEMAITAKEKGMNVVAITSTKVSKNLTSRHSSGKKLFELADIVIDNCTPPEDCVLTLPHSNQKIGAVSTIAGAFIVQLLVSEIINEFLKKKKVPPIYMSSNTPGGDEHNAKLIDKYKERIRCLY